MINTFLIWGNELILDGVLAGLFIDPPELWIDNSLPGLLSIVSIFN